jgi:O-antigen/teichoic acid export membrane protein
MTIRPNSITLDLMFTFTKLSNAARTAKSNDFLRHNAIYFVGSLVISALNYLYYPVLGRMLPLESFGEVQVLISLFTQMTIFVSVLTHVSTNIISNETDTDAVNKTVSELEKITQYVGYAILALIIIAAPYLKTALKFESVWPFFVIGLVFVVGITTGYRTAYLTGKSAFLRATVAGMLTASVKIVASALLVSAGYKTSGAAGGILVAQLIGLAYAAYKARQLGFIRHRSGVRPDWALLRPQARYAGLVLFVSIITTLQYSADVTIVKYLFSPEIAGQYAGIATISRIVLFLTGSFAIVLLSAVKISRQPHENSKLLIRSLLMTLILGGAATLIFVLFPSQVIHLLFGQKYDAFAHLLPLLSVAMLIVSVSSLIANYHLALRHYGVMLYVGLGAVATIGLLIIGHGSPDAVVRSLAIGSGCMLAGLLGWTGYRAGFRLQ